MGAVAMGSHGIRISPGKNRDFMLIEPSNRVTLAAKMYVICIVGISWDQDYLEKFFVQGPCWLILN